MQKLHFFSCALLLIPLTFFTGANAKVDTGDLYPTPIDRQVNTPEPTEIREMRVPGHLNTLLQHLLSGQRRSSATTKSYESIVEMPGFPRLLLEMFARDKMPYGIHPAAIVLPGQHKTATTAGEKRIFAKQKRAATINEKISGRYIKKPKKPAHSGHFYKPFLERPEMFY